MTRTTTTASSKSVGHQTPISSPRDINNKQQQQTMSMSSSHHLGLDPSNNSLSALALSIESAAVENSSRGKGMTTNA
eukprot:CAMPEP_0198140560 /NCGR_PEP_ID=MMETSP1443-20131203/3715_1 /TAXON_ID=186043 /ORGANISM="Entomoneis sp., Strain CCMP2396" /LENGTH=76 /DNA_ID=CAMNT_0043803035 /DNA_START=128 /DNA_END=358 /DNA_ORIENTATION=-